MPLNLASPSRKRGPSLTPLIDVVFILLLFFMLSSSFVRWQTVATPLASQQSDIERGRLSWTLLDNQGLIQFQGQRLHLSDQAAITSIISEYPEHLMLIHAQEHIELQSLLDLAETLSLLGAAQVSLAHALRATP